MDERSPREGGGGFGAVGEDIQQVILSKLPASTFASAACVNRSWNLVCSRILTRPKLVSALSLNPNLEDAVKEVFEKVLEEPIRPHFALASVGKKFSLLDTHELIRSKLGYGIPIMVSQAYGIFGNDALTNQPKEVKWFDDENDREGYNSSENRDRGIVLTLGFLPGMKVRPIPLMKETKEASQPIDKFITDIKVYTASISGCTAPVGIMMFADPYADMEPVLMKMDYAMSRDTIIIGDENGCFVCNNGADSIIYAGSLKTFQLKSKNKYHFCIAEAVALVYATDRGKPQGMGETHFRLALSKGVSPIGPIYKGVSVRVAKDKECKCATWLTARREGSIEKLDGETILQEIENVIEDDALNSELYIAVTKRRRCSIGPNKGRLISTLSFHEVLGGDEAYLYVKGDGIKSGDSFQFFRPDPETALMTRNNVFENLRAMKQNNGDKKMVCGGLIFSCYGRGESFFGQPHVDSSAFLENFPGVPLSGVFCCGEIGRSSSVSIGRANCVQRTRDSILHVYATVYLLVVHTPCP